MHNLILHWFVTLAPVESSEVRVFSYSLRDVMPMAILLWVPESIHVIQPNCHDTVLAKRHRTKTITGQGNCIPGNLVVYISSYHVCTSMTNDLRKGLP